jgi:predicted metal-dependent hydrolase
MDTSEFCQTDDWNFTVVRSRRRTMALVLYPDNRLVIRCGLRTPQDEIRRFVAAKSAWIQRKTRENNDRRILRLPPASQRPAFSRQTRRQVLEIMARFPGYEPARLVIRPQKSRWGSVSSRGTLSINLCAGLLPPDLLEFVVVHELCHLVHFNHSPSFYQLLRQILPDADRRRQELKRYSPDPDIL